jgi:phage gp29-like protein
MLNFIRNLKIAKKSDLVKETSSIRSSYYSEYQDILNGYNPNSLVTKKGLEVFDDMMLDEQVKSALQTKIYAVLAAGWDVHSPAPKYDKHTEFIKNSFNEWLEGSFSDVMIELLTFLKYGYVVAEQNYEYEGNSVYLKNIKVRAPHTFEFHPDEYGNLPKDTGLRQHQNPGGLVPLPIDKFITYSYRMEFSNYYGKSDLLEAYRDWFLKDQMVKMEAIYLEKYASPPIVGKHENMNPLEIQKLMTVLKTMRSSGAIVVPKTVEFEFLNAVANGGNAFRKSIEAKDNAISKAILMPTELGYNKVDNGSNAKAQTQFEVFLWSVENIRKAVEEAIINEQIIKPLIYYNFGEQEKYPYFKFNPLKEKDKMALFSTWIEVLKIKAALPTREDEDYIRKTLEMPERTETSELLEVAPEPTNNPTDPNEPKVDENGDPIEQKKTKDFIGTSKSGNWGHKGYPRGGEELSESDQQSIVDEMVSGGISFDSRVAINRYTRENSFDINRGLRDGAQLDWFNEKERKTISGMDDAMSRTPELKKDISVYRVTKTGKSIPKEGSTFIDKGFVSTTFSSGSIKDVKKSLNQKDGKVISIKVPKGSKILPIQGKFGSREFHGENEGILNRGTKFKVIKNSDNVIELEVML